MISEVVTNQIKPGNCPEK